MKKVFYLLLSVSILFSSCSKEKDIIEIQNETNEVLTSNTNSSLGVNEFEHPILGVIEIGQEYKWSEMTQEQLNSFEIYEKEFAQFESEEIASKNWPSFVQSPMYTMAEIVFYAGTVCCVNNDVCATWSNSCGSGSKDLFPGQSGTFKIKNNNDYYDAVVFTYMGLYSPSGYTIWGSGFEFSIPPDCLIEMQASFVPIVNNIMYLPTFPLYKCYIVPPVLEEAYY